jgi:hypothetical protein
MRDHHERQSRVLLATLTECQSAKGRTYLRGWLGASNVVGFQGEDDEEGRPTWQLFLTERQPKPQHALPLQPRRPRGCGATFEIEAAE